MRRKNGSKDAPSSSPNVAPFIPAASAAADAPMATDLRAATVWKAPVFPLEWLGDRAIAPLQRRVRSLVARLGLQVVLALHLIGVAVYWCCLGCQCRNLQSIKTCSECFEPERDASRVNVRTAGAADSTALRMEQGLTGHSTPAVSYLSSYLHNVPQSSHIMVNRSICGWETH